MKIITWIIGGLEIPGLGVSQAGESIEVDDETAESLSMQGIAKLKRMPEKKIKKEDKGGN